jgi:phosphate transport system substrate-binding protein
MLAVAVACAANGAGGQLPAHTPPKYAQKLVASLPSYRPSEQVSGTIRLWGHGSPKHDFLGSLVRRWTEEFRRYQPRVSIVDRMYGTASGVGALYTGAGNLAILGEEISPAAARAFERERHYCPMRIEIATGSVATNYFDYAHMVFVNRANPLGRMTLGQLAAVFGDPQGRGAHRLRTWGGLGLTGAWAQRPIHPYFWKVDEDFALFFRARVLHGSHRWNPAIRQFVTYPRPDGSVDDRGQQILEALARDPDGIAVSNIRFAGPQVKALALATSRGGPYVSATPQTLITQHYPLTRIIPAFVDLPPGQALDPALREFLRFILSRQGQRAVLEDSGYLPLGRRQIAAQLARLDEAGRCRTGEEPCVPTPPVQTPSRARAPRAATHLVRIWGNPKLAALARRWASGFQATHPGSRVELHMTGSDTGMAGLYTSQADIAILGRTATDSELQAFEWVFRHPPERAQVLRGSLDERGDSPALAVLVHSGNPLRCIGLSQLQGLLERDPPQGVRGIRTWGDLGLKGRWSGRRVHVYMTDTVSGTGRFFRDRVLGGSSLLEWQRITEIPATMPPPGSPAHGHGKIMSALAKDPDGLAITRLPGGSRTARALPVAAKSGGTCEAATRVSVGGGAYPLGRAVFAYLNGAASANAEAAQFVLYVLSREGQAAVRSADGYLPLPPPVARLQSVRLRSMQLAQAH